MTAATSNLFDRPLSPLERSHLAEDGNPIHLLIVTSARGLRNDKKVRDAFERVRATTPMMQVRIEGDYQEAYFRRAPAGDPSLPVLKIMPDQATDKAAVALARRLRDEALATYNEDAQDIPSASCFLVRGPHKAVAVVVSHHALLDGLTLGYVIVKFCLYALAPRWMWNRLDRRSSPSVPTLPEIALGPEYDPARDDLDAPLPPPANIPVPGKLIGLIGSVDDRNITKTCRQQLRTEGATISSAFAALAVKVGALLVDDPVVYCCSSINARTLQKGKRRNLIFGPMANYTFRVVTAFDNAREDSVISMAQRIRADLRRAEADLDFRRECLQSPGHGAGLICGCSSTKFPKAPWAVQTIEAGMKSCEFLNLLYFWIRTTGSITQVDAVIRLEGHDEQKIRNAIRDASAGTPLKPLLNKL